jgi:hypothetical protein
MKALSSDDLAERFGDLIRNLLVHSDDGKAAPRSVRENESWWIAYTHVLEELVLRGETWKSPAIDTRSHMIVAQSERVMKSIRLCKDRSLVHDGCHYKFGKRPHMESMVNEGIVRIAPGSSFADVTMNCARRDAELVVETTPSREDLESLCERDGLPVPVFGYHGDWKYVSYANVDYFVCCVAARFDHRLFDDFEADSCVVIHDPVAFERRLRGAASEELKGWKAFGTEIQYVDPLFPPIETLNPFFCKHFRYYYQQEYRHFWLSQASPSSRLEPFLANVGSLRDCCELVSLS